MLAAAALLMGFGASANAYDSYNLAAHQLTIPAIQVGSTIYKDVIVSIGLSQIISVRGGVQASTADEYVGGVLTIPVVFVNGVLYTNVTARVALSNVLYVGSASPALSCGEASEGGSYGVGFYDPQNIIGFSLPYAANSNGAASLIWGAINTGSSFSYTGSLRVSLWLVNSPFFGGTIVGDQIAEVTPNFTGPGAYSPTQLLGGGYSYSSNTAFGTVNTPAPGQYCVVMTLEMYSPGQCASSGGYCYMDWHQFPYPAFFN
jgi:hypothetical protein